MTAVLYHNSPIDFTKEPLFFGTGKNTQRYDVVKHQIFDTLFEKMAGQDWVHDEIACTKDKTDFQFLSQAMKHAYTSVLNKLIFLDSIQGRGILQTVGSVITNPEFESCVTEWQRFEISRHSRSYTHILRSVYDNPSEVFDQSFAIPELLSLASTISTPYEDCFTTITNYHAGTASLREAKTAILKMFVEINILEGLRFYSGFATIWSMHYTQGLMERTSKILQLICRDENLHLGCTQALLRILRTHKDEGFTETYRELSSYIKNRFLDAYDEECVWIDYLFKEGSFLGMSAELAKSYLKYLVNTRMQALDLDPPFAMQHNPLPWITSYISFDSNFVPLQESEAINYKMDILNTDIAQDRLQELMTEIK